ncbi:MAG: hypothetical protein ACPGWR_15030 [Ardenticatenaceae bacterium]
MSLTTLEPMKAALLLRELAEEVLIAEGAARNGIFLELHRLHDTIFRLALESHPDAPPEVSSLAFSRVNALPAPQVVRKLWELNSELVTPEIRKFYKHMNVARNNMAHDAVLERVMVSRSNSKRMARLATLLANQLDPEQEAMPDLYETPAPRPLWHRHALYLSVGFIAGVCLCWALLGTSNPAIVIATITIIVTIIGGLFMLDQ